ncbi:MAG: HAMP domain-containing histidine kinase [bacterium]|nr:HAMP domain-containing histidine kinase [bacterium]
MDIKIAQLEEGAQSHNTSIKLLIRRDLELGRANEKLQEVDEIKSNFISVVAHQLRTPLSGIKWTLEMFLNGDLGEISVDQKTFLMKSAESNSRMIALVNDMLETDRIQSGKMHYGFRNINIVDLLDNVLFELSQQARKRGVTFAFKSKLENIPQVYIDPDTMRAVIQNLLENALKYCRKGGTIELDVQPKKEMLELSVKDNGIGVPVDEQKKLFGRFFRARNAIKHETDGSGLGLYIAKTIVEKNGGKIWFDSVEGIGTTFYFTLPIAAIIKP